MFAVFCQYFEILIEVFDWAALLIRETCMSNAIWVQRSVVESMSTMMRGFLLLSIPLASNTQVQRGDTLLICELPLFVTADHANFYQALFWHFIFCWGFRGCFGLFFPVKIGLMGLRLSLRRLFLTANPPFCLWGQVMWSLWCFL